MILTVADIIVLCMEKEGIDCSFGITGSHLLSFFNSLKDSHIKYVSVKHEAAAAFMALNYARVAQKPALVIATAGPGAANLVNGIIDLKKTQVPCFILSPTVSSNSFGKNAFQEDSGYGLTYSVADLFRSITKRSLLLTNPKLIVDHLHELFRYAFTPPYGPVHLCVPADLFTAEVEVEIMPPRSYRLVDDERIEPNKLEEVSLMLKHANNPVIIVGGRCVYPNCSLEIDRLANKLQIPVISTLMGKGVFDEDNPLFCGVIDYFGHRSAEKFIKESDLIIALGMDFSETETLKFDPSLFDANNLVSVDCIDNYLGVNYPLKLAICGSIRASVGEICRRCEKSGTSDLNSIKTIHQQYLDWNKNLLSEIRDSKVPLTVPFLLNEISQRLCDSLTFMDGSAIGVSSARHFKANRNRYFANGAACSIGQGVCGVIGGKFAAPERSTFCITGDGAFLMHGNEVLTAVQYQMGITWIVFKDGLYNMIDINQKMAYSDNLSFCTKFQNPDFEKLSQALDVCYFEIRIPEDIQRTIRQAKIANSKGKCALIIVEYDCREHLPVKPRLVETMRDMGQTKEIQANPFLLRAFAKALKEKV